MRPRLGGSATRALQRTKVSSQYMLGCCFCRVPPRSIGRRWQIAVIVCGRGMNGVVERHEGGRLTMAEGDDVQRVCL